MTQGMPYKYVVSVDSKGFDEAPNDMLQALGRLSWATEKAVISTGDVHLPPNELLALGYFEEMKIGVSQSCEFENMLLSWAKLSSLSSTMTASPRWVPASPHYLLERKQLCSSA